MLFSRSQFIRPSLNLDPLDGRDRKPKIKVRYCLPTANTCSSRLLHSPIASKGNHNFLMVAVAILIHLEGCINRIPT